MEYKDIDILINKFGSEVIEAMKKELQTNGDVATGQLLNSLKVEISSDIKQTIIKFLSVDYANYVEFGRKAGTYPPISKIKEWTKVKGLPEGAAFPIARKIYKFGIKPKPFIFKNFNDKKAAFINELANLYAKDISKDIINTFKTNK